MKHQRDGLTEPLEVPETGILPEDAYPDFWISVEWSVFSGFQTSPNDLEKERFSLNPNFDLGLQCGVLIRFPTPTWYFETFFVKEILKGSRANKSYKQFRL